MIELLTTMLAAWHECRVVPPGVHDTRRPYYIKRLNDFGQLTMAQIAAITNTSRQQVKIVLDRQHIKPGTDTVKGLLNPEGIEIMLISAKHIYLREPIPSNIKVPLAFRCGDPAIVAKLIGMPLSKFRDLREAVAADAVPVGATAEPEV